MPLPPEDDPPSSVANVVDDDSDNNPWPVHLACRLGDLDEVKHLVNVLHYNVNESDHFDATPLYLAALCGHAHICEFLLMNGAKCEGDEAARVFYAALTSELRELLREWALSASTSTSKYEPFLRVLFHDLTRDATHSDCYVSTPTRGENNKIYLHKVLLRELCPRLLDCCDETDGTGKQVIDIPWRSSMGEIDHKDSLALMLVEYLYTGCCELRGNVDPATCLAAMATDLGLDALRSEVEEALMDIERSSREGQATATRQESTRTDFACSIAHDSKAKLQDLARRVTETPCLHFEPVEFSDMTITWSSPDPAAAVPSRKWFVHAGILAAHSDYFACAVHGSFLEADQSSIDLSHMVPTDHVVDMALQWMYCGSFLVATNPESSTLDVAVAVVEFAAAILCPNLCQFAAQTLLIPSVTSETVFEMLDLARQYGLERLEDRCVSLIAQSLLILAPSEGLHRVLRDEIRQTSQRGDARVLDVPLAAEIRSVIRKLPSHSAPAVPVSDGCQAESCEDKAKVFALLDEALNRAIAAEARATPHSSL